MPLNVRLEGARVVAVGAGPVAAGKALPLLDAGAALTVIAPEAVEPLRRAAEAGRLRWLPRPYRPGDLRGALLVLAGTASGEVNRRVAADAAAQSTLCVRVDGGGSAALSAEVRRGPLSIAVSTDGQAPALAARLRAELEAAYGPEYGQVAALLGELRRRPDVRASMAALPAAERRARWRAVLDADILTLVRAGQPATATEVALACLCSSSD